MRDEELVQEAFTLIGGIRPGEAPALADQKFGLDLLRFAPKDQPPSVWLARQLAPIYDIDPLRLPEFARC